MNRPMFNKQITNYKDGGVASLIPRRTDIYGQDHMLAYIRPDEAALLKSLGGAGTPGPGGVPQYGWLKDTWDEITSGGAAVTETYNGDDYAAQSTYNGGQDSLPTGTVDFTLPPTSSDDKPATVVSVDFGDSGTVTDDKYTFYDDKGNETAAPDVKTVTANVNPYTESESVGLVDSILMGIGAKTKTPEYYKTTLETIAKTQGSNAAELYKKMLGDVGLDNTSIKMAVDSVDINKVANSTPKQTSGGGGGGGTTTPKASTTTPKASTTTAQDTGIASVTDIIDGTFDVGNLASFEQRYANALSEYDPATTNTLDFRKLVGGLESPYRPTTAELASITGFDLETAEELLNPVGLTYDFRNWQSILTSDDPAEATKEATYAMYLTPDLFTSETMPVTPEGFDLGQSQGFLFSTSPNYFGSNPITFAEAPNPNQELLDAIAAQNEQIQSLTQQFNNFSPTPREPLTGLPPITNQPVTTSPLTPSSYSQGTFGQIIQPVTTSPLTPSSYSQGTFGQIIQPTTFNPNSFQPNNNQGIISLTQDPYSQYYING